MPYFTTLPDDMSNRTRKHGVRTVWLFVRYISVHLYYLFFVFHRVTTLFILVYSCTLFGTLFYLESQDELLEFTGDDKYYELVESVITWSATIFYGVSLAPVFKRKTSVWWSQELFFLVAEVHYLIKKQGFFLVFLFYLKNFIDSLRTIFYVCWQMVKKCRVYQLFNEKYIKFRNRFKKK